MHSSIFIQKFKGGLRVTLGCERSRARGQPSDARRPDSTSILPLNPIIRLNHGTVLPVPTFGADSGRCAAREPRGASCLVSAGTGSFSVCAAENTRSVQGWSRNKFRWLGHIPEPGRDCAICNHCVSEAQGETPLASAQPIDRYLCLYRRHP